jgi:hypothetical protein
MLYGTIEDADLGAKNLSNIGAELSAWLNTHPKVETTFSSNGVNNPKATILLTTDFFVKLWN